MKFIPKFDEFIPIAGGGLARVLDACQTLFMRIRGEEIVLPDRRHLAGSIGFVVGCVAAVSLSWFLANPVEASAPPLSNQIPQGYVPISALLSSANANLTANNSSSANCPTGEVLLNSAGACGNETNSTVSQSSSLPDTQVPVTAPTVVAPLSNAGQQATRVHVPRVHLHLHQHRRTTAATTTTTTTTPAA